MDGIFLVKKSGSPGLCMRKPLFFAERESTSDIEQQFLHRNSGTDCLQFPIDAAIGDRTFQLGAISALSNFDSEQPNRAKMMAQRFDGMHGAAAFVCAYCVLNFAVLWFSEESLPGHSRSVIVDRGGWMQRHLNARSTLKLLDLLLYLTLRELFGFFR